MFGVMGYVHEQALFQAYNGVKHGPDYFFTNYIRLGGGWLTRVDLKWFISPEPLYTKKKNIQ